jgi:hypothetical protein
MAKITKDFQAMTEDIKTSWYFRLWALLWLVSFIVSLVALGELANISEAAQTDGELTLTVYEPDSINFPRFHIRSDTVQFLSFSCTHQSSPVPTQPCPGKTNTSYCFTVMAQPFSAQRGSMILDNPRIVCTINSTANAADDIIAWELEGDDTVGSNSYASIWLVPDDSAWVLISKYELGDGKVGWERNLLYHSGLKVPGYYMVSTIINTPKVIRLNEHENYYDGWQVVADIGGFAFFMYCLHAIMMILAGVFFDNDSKFLGGGGQYNTVA